MQKRNYKKVVSILFSIFAMGISTAALCQEISTEPPAYIQQQLEDLTAQNEDAETEDDSYLQELQYYVRHPVNLNYADANALQQLKILSPVQIESLLSYRKLLGNFLSVYELQAVPTWDLNLINRISPYVTVAPKADVIQSIRKRLFDGEQSLMVRTQQVLEKSKGFLVKNDSVKNFYPGSPQKLLLRYKYRSGNYLQYGFTAEKDAGEQFFRGAQKNGFDFYSAHFFARNLGIIKCVAIGDYAVNLGQGLTQWQSLAFNKGPAIINVLRQGDVLQPYSSAGEINFNRGIGITLQKKNWQSTGFISYRNLDAGFDADTLADDMNVSSLQASGYHRTANEIKTKGSLGAFGFGGNVSYSHENFHLGMNAVHYDFTHAVSKPDYWYNKYALAGNSLTNYSIDYSITVKNAYFFGELAADKNCNKALISGVVLNTDSKISMSMLYRNLSKGYQALYASAFTENSKATNESGFYSGITITVNEFFRIDANADFYHFPWLKYRTDAPTSGNDYMAQITFQPKKNIVIHSRFQFQNKPINFNPENLYMNPVTGRPKKNWRSQFKFALNKEISFGSRLELTWVDKNGAAPENGFLFYSEIFYKPSLQPFSMNARFCYFETDGYDSRIYAFENDVLYAYSIPVFSGKGCRYYFNLRYKVNKKLSLFCRFAQTIYDEKKEIGSGLDVIKGNKKSEIKLQAMYSF
jgi:hypothetical protein